MIVFEASIGDIIGYIWYAFVYGFALVSGFQGAKKLFFKGLKKEEK